MSLYLGTTPIADGASTALLATKAGVDLSNCTKPYIVESYYNGLDWYILYSDGTIEVIENELEIEDLKKVL